MILKLILEQNWKLTCLFQTFSVSLEKLKNDLIEKIENFNTFKFFSKLKIIFSMHVLILALENDIEILNNYFIYQDSWNYLDRIRIHFNANLKIFDQSKHSNEIWHASVMKFAVAFAVFAGHASAVTFGDVMKVQDSFRSSTWRSRCMVGYTDRVIVPIAEAFSTGIQGWQFNLEDVNKVQVLANKAGDVQYWVKYIDEVIAPIAGALSTGITGWQFNLDDVIMVQAWAKEAGSGEDVVRYIDNQIAPVAFFLQGL